MLTQRRDFMVAGGPTRFHSFPSPVEYPCKLTLLHSLHITTDLVGTQITNSNTNIEHVNNISRLLYRYTAVNADVVFTQLRGPA